MRHGIAGNKLNRFSSWRKATIRDVAKATLIQQRIQTTKAKAKEARKLVDQLITLGKDGSLAAKRRAYKILCDHRLVSELFRETSPRFKSRNGGYTRIILLGNRRGDNAQLAYLELTEKKDVIISKPKTSAATKKGEVVDIQTSDAEEQTTKSKKETKDDKKEAVKDTSSKKDVVKPDVKKPVTDKDAKGRNIVGGIRKMFKRKSSGK